MAESATIIRDRLTALRSAMDAEQLDAFIVTHDDEYLSSSVTPDSRRVEFICGFTGSAGTAVILQPRRCTGPGSVTGISGTTHEALRSCALFTDGRYSLQARAQLDEQQFSIFSPTEVTPTAFLAAQLPAHSRIGIDLNTVSYQVYTELQSQLDDRHLELVGRDGSLVDGIWEERPQAPCTPVIIYEDEYNGCPSLVKRQNLAHELQDSGYDATVISRAETICWLLNIRGHDRPSLPVVNSRLVAFANESLEWYIDERHLDDQLRDQLSSHCGHLDVFPPESFAGVLRRLGTARCTVYIDPSANNAMILSTLHGGGATVIEGTGICELPKAIKNPLELAGAQQAHVRDGIALCRFLAWLDDLCRPTADPAAYPARVSGHSEATLSEHAEECRRLGDNYLEPSFDTISALGPNAAMCHYTHTSAPQPRALGADALYLIDSGAHYLEGTTDVTRTVLVGPGVTEEQRRLYTLVLRSHIALSTTLFPPGTSGLQLDAVARRPLWSEGLDYPHGTGHGVGHVLNVHEGPQNISTRSSLTPLAEGMILSIEPGYYRDGAFGIRLENLVMVARCTRRDCQHMLCFVPITLVPFDRRLIVREMLTAAERSWLNDYHARVRTVLSRSASTFTPLEADWLEQATQPL